MRPRRPLRVLLLTGVLALPCRAPAAPEPVPGIVSAVYDADLGASLPGIVSNIRVKPGDRVKAGDVLIEFDSATEDLEVERRKLVWESKTALEAARHKLAAVTKDVESTRKLYKSSKSVSLDELEMKELELKLAEAQVRELETGEQREEIEWRLAREQANRRRSTAPVDGVVMEVHFEKGEYAQLHDPLLRLVNADACYFTCNVTPDRFDRLKTGQTMTVEFGASPGALTFKAEVIFVSSLVDPASGLKEVRLRFVNPNGRVSPGAKGMLVLD